MKSATHQIDLVPMGSDEITRGILGQTLDAGVTQEEINTAQYARKRLFKDHFCLVVPRSFISKPHLGIESWKRQTVRGGFCAYKSDWLSVQAILSHLKVEPLPAEQFVFPDWETLEARVQAGLNWSLIPSSFIRKAPTYLVHEVDQSPEQIFYLYYRKSISRLPGIRKWLQLS
jgi:DNA-binding transcriptional LysR family regulator